MKIEEIAPTKLAREFVVKKGTDGQFYWHAKATNGKTTFQGESHPEAGKAIRAIEQEMKALGSTQPIRITVINGTKKEVRNLPAPVVCPSLNPPVSSDGVEEPAASAEQAPSLKPLRGAARTSPATSTMIRTALANHVQKPPEGAVTMPASDSGRI